MKKVALIPVIIFALTSLFVGSAFTVQHNGNGNPDEPTFQEFLAQFPKAGLPYTFNASDLQAQLEQRNSAPKATRLGWEYYQFLPSLEESARFSRMPVYPEPVAMFETKEHYAVLYNTGRGFTKNVKSYHIAVFDKQGNHLATHFVAGVNPNMLTAATIDENLNATINAFQVNWNKDYQQFGLDGNSINGLTPAGTQTIPLATAETMVEEVKWVSNSTTLTASNTADSK